MQSCGKKLKKLLNYKTHTYAFKINRLKKKHLFLVNNRKVPKKSCQLVSVLRMFVGVISREIVIVVLSN